MVAWIPECLSNARRVLAPAALVFWIRRYVEEPAKKPRAASLGPMHLFAALKRPYVSTTWRKSLGAYR